MKTEKEIDSNPIPVCILVTLLGITAAALGFVAENTKVKAVYNAHLQVEPLCVAPSSPAIELVAVAIGALLSAHAIITGTSGGYCSCCRNIPNLSNLSRLCIVISWITSCAAVVLFLNGMISSRNSGVSEINGLYYCYLITPGIYLGAAIVSFISVLFGIAYYLSYVSAVMGANH